MPMPLQDIEAQALQLPVEERGWLVERLLQSLDAESDDTPESIVKAWEEEIARRIEAMDAGLTEAILYEQVRAEIRAMVDSYRKL